jgi:hypothetical protein
MRSLSHSAIFSAGYQAGFARAEAMETLERCLAIVEQANRVNDNDEIKRPGKRFEKLFVFDVPLDK